MRAVILALLVLTMPGCEDRRQASPIVERVCIGGVTYLIPIIGSRAIVGGSARGITAMLDREGKVVPCE